MRLVVIVQAFSFGPLIVALINAMLQPHDQPRHVTRYRCFRVCGASRWQAALWMMGGGL